MDKRLVASQALAADSCRLAVGGHTHTVTVAESVRRAFLNHRNRLAIVQTHGDFRTGARRGIALDRITGHTTCHRAANRTRGVGKTAAAQVAANRAADHRTGGGADCGRITLDGDWTHIGHHTKLHRLGALGFILAHHVALVCGTTCQHGRCKNSTSDNTHGGRQDGHGITRFHSVMGVCETQAVQAASVGIVPYCTAPQHAAPACQQLGLVVRFRYHSGMKSLWTLLLTTLFLAGCQPPVRLMPTPEIFLQGEVNPFAVNQALDKSNEIQVFYATNRLPLGPTHARHYTIVPGDNLSLGIATLNIGGGAKTWEWLYQLSTTADDNEDRPPLVLDSMQELAVVDGNLASPLDSPEGDAFFKQINDALEKSVDKDLTIYVHGANTSVERAAGQAAQYRHFTGRNSVVLFFAWPSAENFMRYATDVANARRSEPQFARLLELLSKHTQAKSLNVLAYSAGAMVASPGLARLDQLPQGEEHPAVRLGEIYQAAPDANFRSFAADLQRYVPLARRVTFSANMNDSVLTISRIHQRDGSRAGRPDPTELSLADSEWLINASKTMNFDVLQIKPATIPGMSRRSHNFWFGHPWVSSDVIIKFWFHAPPDARGLQNNASARNLQYWTFPPDYDKRMVEAVTALVANTPETGTAASKTP